MAARKVPDRELIEDLHRVYREHGTTSCSFYQRGGGRHAHQTIYKRFGDWWSFVEAAGLPHAPGRWAADPATRVDRRDYSGRLREELARERLASRKLRTCLYESERCEKLFLSDGPERRRCPRCEHIVASQPSPVFEEVMW